MILIELKSRMYSSIMFSGLISLFESVRITINENVFELKENQSCFIPEKTRHRLQNKKQFDLEIIEVQTGFYLEEDDILRFDDEYGR